MTLSLNEVEALAKKAARGAGYHWGLAEEAAKATRWLCARNIDGCAELAELLVEHEASEDMTDAPLPGEVWTSRGGGLCPVKTGCALSDRAEALGSAALRIENVTRPILLAPFAGASAPHLKKTIALIWDDVHVSTDGAALYIAGNPHTVRATVTMIATTETGPATLQPTASRAEPDPEAYATLERFAHRTYAPATEASRLTGAGAGLSDND